MTAQQRKVVGIMVVLVVAGFVYLAVQANRRKKEQKRLREMEKIKVQKAKRRTKPVVFAKENVKKRSKIRAEWLEVKEVEERDLPKKDYAEALDEVVGKIALVDMYMGEPIIKARYTDEDQVTALSFIIKEGMRAVSVKIQTIDACGGFLKQGDKVDILATFSLKLDQSRNSRKTRVTSYLMKDVVVLAIDKKYELSKEEKDRERRQERRDEQDKGSVNPYRARASVSMVTFLVTPEEAERLVIASQKARLKLVLTPETDAGSASKADILQEVITQQIFQPKKFSRNKKDKDDEPEQVKVEIIAGRRKQEKFLRSEEPPPPPDETGVDELEPLEEPADWGDGGDDDFEISLPSLGP